MTIQSSLTLWCRPLSRLFFLGLFVAVPSLTSCQAADRTMARPVVEVAIGITPQQMRDQSTYPFEVDEKNPRNNMLWSIYRPYDLHYSYRGHKLVLENVGGEFFFTAITNGFPAYRIDSIHVGPQTEELTLDAALAEGKRLQNWFLTAGFQPIVSVKRTDITDGKGEPLNQRVVSTVYNEKLRILQTAGSGQWRHLESWADVRTAMLDPSGKIVTISLFHLNAEAGDVGVSLNLMNGRRLRTYSDNGVDAKERENEAVYRLQLDIVRY